ncbi:MAG: hypothetical protein MPN21_06815 [Thermoanaerobaculia bacterium]|nr:hypothetical protein [Thermoanaerobaculia bacterium]
MRLPSRPFALGAAFALGVFPASLLADDSAPGRATDETSPLHSILTLSEYNRSIAAPVSGELPLLLGVETQDVDVNSSIRIRVDLRGQSVLGTSQSPAHRLLHARATLLRELVQGIAAASDATTKVARALENQNSGEDVEALSADHEEAMQRLSAHLLTAVNTGALDRQLADRWLVGESWGPFGEAVSRELERTAAELRELEDISGEGFALAMAVDHLSSKGGRTPQGLAHYSTLDLPAPRPIDKLRIVPTPDQLAKMEEARQQLDAIAQTWNAALQSGRSVGEVLKEAFRRGELADEITTIEDRIEEITVQVKSLRTLDWDGLQDSTESALESQADLVRNQARQSLRELEVRVALARPSLLDLIENLEGIAEQVRDAEKVDGLELFLRVASILEALSNLENTSLPSTSDLAGSLADTRTDLEEILGSLPDALGESLLPIWEPALQPLRDLGTAIQELPDEARALIAKLRVFPGHPPALEALSSLLKEGRPQTSPLRLLSVAKSTQLELQRINPRREDDLLVLRAWLYSLDGENEPRIVDEVSQTFRLLRFGWYNQPSLGIAYLSSLDPLEGADDEAQAFVPHTSWLFLHRKWRDASELQRPAQWNPRWFERFGFGFHAVALDLNKDSEQEIGLGLTISFAKDWFQLGIGIDVSLDNEPYYFIGSRVLKLGGAIRSEENANN